jgi:hypothetical protein
VETITRRRLLQAAGITGVAASIPAPLLALTP